MHTRLPSPSATASRSAADRSAVAQRAANRTGLPDALKAGVERLSGMSMDHVRVHRNSARPAQLAAQAFAQGGDIHVAPGQDRHLPHEAWHVVQQAQGRVRPTLQMAGVAVNDDRGLEHEADVMGARATHGGAGTAQLASAGGRHSATVQRVPQWLKRGTSALLTPVRAATSIVGGLGRLTGYNPLGYYATTTVAGLTAEQRAGLNMAKASPSAYPGDPAWLTALLPGTRTGEFRFTAARRRQFAAQWGVEHANNHWRLPGVKGAGGYQEYGCEPANPADRTLGQNRILRETNDPTGTYWWVTPDHYTTFSYIKDA